MTTWFETRDTQSHFLLTYVFTVQEEHVVFVVVMCADVTETAVVESCHELQQKLVNQINIER